MVRKKFSGQFDVRVVYSLTDDNELRIEYRATPTDRATVINLTNHSFFNLATADGRPTSSDSSCRSMRLRQGRLHTPARSSRRLWAARMDFRKPMAVGSRIKDDYPELRPPATPGYDQNFVLDKSG